MILQLIQKQKQKIKQNKKQHEKTLQGIIIDFLKRLVELRL